MPAGSSARCSRPPSPPAGSSAGARTCWSRSRLTGSSVPPPVTTARRQSRSPSATSQCPPCGRQAGSGLTSSVRSAAELLAAASAAQPPALGRVEHPVGDGGDGDRQDEQDQWHVIGNRQRKQDERDDDTGDAVLHVGRHTGLPLVGGTIRSRALLTS